MHAGTIAAMAAKHSSTENPLHKKLWRAGARVLGPASIEAMLYYWPSTLSHRFFKPAVNRYILANAPRHVPLGQRFYSIRSNAGFTGIFAHHRTLSH